MIYQTGPSWGGAGRWVNQSFILTHDFGLSKSEDSPGGCSAYRNTLDSLLLQGWHGCSCWCHGTIQLGMHLGNSVYFELGLYVPPARLYGSFWRSDDELDYVPISMLWFLKYYSVVNTRPIPIVLPRHPSTG